MTRIAGFGEAELLAHQAKVKRPPPHIPVLDVLSPDKPRKYRNVPTTVGNEKFHSKREADRYGDLQILERSGVIGELRRQVKYLLIPRQNDANGKCLFRAVTYTADFVYVEAGKTVVEDAKGYPNDRWPMKKALMFWVHGILVREV